MIGIKVSLASYSFHKLLEAKMIDVYGYLESLAYRYHLSDADIWNGYLLEMGREDFKKIRTAMDERGITLASLCCDWANFYCADPDWGKKCDENAEKYMEAAEILGARTVRMDVGVPEEDITEEQYEAVYRKLSAYAKRGGDAGFIIGPENHWGASRRYSLQQRLFRDINSPHYGILLHLGNWNLEEGQTLETNDIRAASMAVHTHVDYEHALAAESWLPGLLSSGYSGVWSIEHHKGIAEYRGVQAQLGALLYALEKIQRG